MSSLEERSFRGGGGGSSFGLLPFQLPAWPSSLAATCKEQKPYSVNKQKKRGFKNYSLMVCSLTFMIMTRSCKKFHWLRLNPPPPSSSPACCCLTQRLLSSRCFWESTQAAQGGDTPTPTPTLAPTTKILRQAPSGHGVSMANGDGQSFLPWDQILQISFSNNCWELCKWLMAWPAYSDKWSGFVLFAGLLALPCFVLLCHLIC